MIQSRERFDAPGGMRTGRRGGVGRWVRGVRLYVPSPDIRNRSLCTKGAQCTAH